MTKLAKILEDKGWTQRDLQREILDKYDFKLGDDRISRMVNGKLTNYHINTAIMVADALQVTIDDIIDF
jgi:transcriptional regulator with XRE-family HTH domain